MAADAGAVSGAISTAPARAAATLAGSSFFDMVTSEACLLEALPRAVGGEGVDLERLRRLALDLHPGRARRHPGNGKAENLRPLDPEPLDGLHRTAGRPTV